MNTKEIESAIIRDLEKKFGKDAKIAGVRELENAYQALRYTLHPDEFSIETLTYIDGQGTIHYGGFRFVSEATKNTLLILTRIDYARRLDALKYEKKMGFAEKDEKLFDSSIEPVVINKNGMNIKTLAGRIAKFAEGN